MPIKGAMCLLMKPDSLSLAVEVTVVHGHSDRIDAAETDELQMLAKRYSHHMAATAMIFC
jgi:hypothetical protein